MRYVEVPLVLPAFDAFLTALAPTRANGATRVARLRATRLRPEDKWFSTASNLDTNETFRALLTSDAAKSALGDVLARADFPYGTPPPFWQVASGALMLDGELAGLLARGGAYVRFAGTDAEAKRIAMAAARELIEDRYEDFRVYYSDSPWSPWFFDVAWDATWLLVDERKFEVTIIATTDTD